MDTKELSGFVQAGHPTPTPKPEDTPKVEDAAKVEAAKAAIPATDADPTKAETKPDTKDAKAGDSVLASDKPPVVKVDDPAEKRAKDSAKWANEVHKQNLALKATLDKQGKDLEEVKALLKGETPKAEPTMTTEQKTERAALEAKAVASRQVAEEKYGAEEIQRLILAEDAPYRALEQDPAIYARVMNAKLPFLEAMKVLKEHDLQTKHGTNDWTAIIHKEVAAALEAKKDELVKDAMAKLNGKTTDDTRGLSGARNAGDGKPVTLTAPAPQVLLSRVFPHGAASI